MSEVTCPSCGRPAPGTAKFCRACGTSLAGATPAPEAPQPAPEWTAPAGQQPDAAPQPAPEWSPPGEASPAEAVTQAEWAAPAAPPPEPAPAAVAPMPPASPDGSRRNLVLAIVALVLLVGGGVTAFALTRDDPQPRRAAATVRTATAPAAPTTPADDPRLTATTPAAPAPAEEDAAISEDEAFAVLDDYVSRYEAADASDLAELFTDDFERRPGEGKVQDRVAARREYASQFDQFPAPDYELTNRTYTPSGTDAAVRSDYAIRSDGKRVGGGSIRFVLTREDDEIRIRKISIRRDG